MITILPSNPILSCKEALAFETKYFGGDQEREWRVMNQAGDALGDSLLRDMRELRTIPHRPRILVLVGKGHNGGDALIAAKRLLKTIPSARAVLWQVCKWQDCRPLCQRAHEEMIELVGKRVEEVEILESLSGREEIENVLAGLVKDLNFSALIDGVLGMQAKLPLRSPISDLVSVVNQSDEISVRASVDMPTGIGQGSNSEALRADFTYTTGIAKSPLIEEENQKWTGRLRYLDLGFFENGANSLPLDRRKEVLCGSALKKLRKLRPAVCDKRSNGHLFLLAGSRELGGAAMMAAQAALKAGVGLLTVGIPESLHASFVAQRPEAMWVPLPETPEGGLALEGLGMIRQFLSKTTALAIGPGLGAQAETHSLAREVLNLWKGNAILDADALRPEILEKISSPDRLILTPHVGEFDRFADSQSLVEYSSATGSIVVLKSAHSQIVSPEKHFYSFSGSSILARGGSGDLLTGIIGALLAKAKYDLFSTAALGVLWHGRAAEVLARQHGQEAVFTTDILDYLSFAIRNDF
jgi:NAD(P)H-hydrate epimerase